MIIIRIISGLFFYFLAVWLYDTLKNDYAQLIHEHKAGWFAILLGSCPILAWLTDEALRILQAWYGRKN